MAFGEEASGLGLSGLVTSRAGEPECESVFEGVFEFVFEGEVGRACWGVGAGWRNSGGGRVPAGRDQHRPQSARNTSRCSGRPTEADPAATGSHADLPRTRTRTRTRTRPRTRPRAPSDEGYGQSSAPRAPGLLGNACMHRAD